MDNLPLTAPCTIIRVAKTTSALLPELTRLYQQFAAHEGHTTPISQFTDFVTARLADDTMLAILAQIEGHAVGYALAFDVGNHPFIPNWERCGYLTNLFVMEAFQRRGIGHSLVDYTLMWLGERGVTRIMLNVDVDNPAGEQFWHKQEFRPVLTRMKRML